MTWAPAGEVTRLERASVSDAASLNQTCPTGRQSWLCCLKAASWGFKAPAGGSQASIRYATSLPSGLGDLFKAWLLLQQLVEIPLMAAKAIGSEVGVRKGTSECGTEK